MNTIAKICTPVTRYDIFPAEIWLSIFKHIDVQDLFRKRVLSKYFKSLIDNNLKSFYNNFSKIHPKLFCKINNKVTIDNFIKGYTFQYIENFREYNCSPFYIDKIKNENITLPQAKLILNLNNNHNIKFHNGLHCINFNSQQIDQMFKLKEMGIPIYFCILYSNTTLYSEKQLNQFIDLLKMGVNYYFANEVLINFNNERFEYFCKLVNNDIWFARAYNIAEQKIF